MYWYNISFCRYMTFQLFSITFISMELFPEPSRLLHKDAQKTRQLWSVQQGPFNNDWMMPIVPLKGPGKEKKSQSCTDDGFQMFVS